MGRRLIPTLVCLLLLSEEAAAGWYHVENYVGFLGPDPIHFSIQTYDSFGSGITAEGSYFYDAKRSPVVLYGKASGTKLELCEISDDSAFNRTIIIGSKAPIDTTQCPLSLDLDDSGATGTWSKGDKKYPVTLRKVAMLDDTGDGQIDGTVEIPFWAQTATHMFSGIYANTPAGICMERMQIINKSSTKIDQQIDFDSNDCNAGMLMTPIYLNVEKQANGDGDIVFVNFRDNRAGYTMDYVFDSATRKFVLKN
ncbi:hypothetical protein JJB09_06445 [Rhizobium sp. KVB221]|uniref:Uncharacterized protein n=1 Tax=Rhizobium setariae TaxID=2801340 RepID=A0A937CLH8_9HYPH|nr:hypothetical protein [Rhizobium setariae]MBL0371661.1 hypothetical protein [Rhizobium setariae]